MLFRSEEDSDLEEDDDDDFSDDELAVTPPTIATEKLRSDPSELVTIEHSDIISVSDQDSFSESSDPKEKIEPTHFGKVVVIEDVAFVTYVAFYGSDACTETRVLDSRLYFVTCTPARLSSPHGDPRNGAKPAPPRRFLSHTEFPNHHPNLSTGLPTR